MNISNRILGLLIAIFLVSLYVPFLSTRLNIAFMALFNIYVFLAYPQEYKQKSFRYITAFLFIEILYLLIGKGVPLITLLYSTLQFFTGITLCKGLKILSKKQTSVVFVCVLIALVYSMIWTYYYLQIDPLYIRHFGYSNDGEFIMPFYMSGIVYANGESLAILLPALFAYSLNSRNKVVMGLTSLVVVCGIVLQFMAALATSAVLSLVFCAIVLIMRVLRTGEKISIATVIVLLSVVAFVSTKYLSTNVNTQMLIKLEDINDSYNSGQYVGQVGSRFDLYSISIKTFVHNPILGLGDIPTEFGSYTGSTVSMHTAIFDYLGLYGIFALLLFAAWIATIRELFSDISKEHVRLYMYSIWSLLLLLLLKGPVTIGFNFIVSTAILRLIIQKDQYRNPFGC